MEQLDFINEVVVKYGSPLYLYNLDIIDNRINDLKRGLPSKAKIFYSLKANPIPSIVKRMVEKGLGLEVSSLGELDVAINAAASPRQILYSGPAKTLREIRKAIDTGVRCFSCESPVDFERIERASRSSPEKIDVILRLNPTHEENIPLSMSGVSSQFGFELETLHDFMKGLDLTKSNVMIVGFHIYYGTQIQDLNTIRKIFHHSANLCEELARRYSLSLKVIDFGGGFPSPYTIDSPVVEISENQFSFSDVPAKYQCWFESGRFLVASSGTLISKVIDIKLSKGRKFVVLDTGIHHIAGMSSLGRIHFPRIVPVSFRENTEEREVVDIVGPLCSPLDCLGRQVSMPLLEIGDLLAIPNVGAYGLTASLLGFLSHPAPLEISYRNTGLHEVHCYRTGHRVFER